MSILTKHRDIDMTEGPLLRKVALFVFPLMVTNLLQMTYNATDMMVVSLSPNPNAVGGVGTCAAFINLVLNVFIGFSVGANVTVARFIGAKDDENTSKTVHTAVLLGALLGLLACVIGQFASRPILVLMGNDGALLDLALLYTRIYFFGVPFIAVSNYAISILRAKGDTRTPLIVLTCTGLLNVALNLFFVLVLKMGVAGAAALTAALALGLVSASAQMSYMMGFLPHLFSRSSPLLEMAGWIPSELRWAGFAALLVGIVLSVRRRNRPLIPCPDPPR